MLIDDKTLPLHILARVHAKRSLGYGGLKTLAQKAADRVPEGSDADEAFRAVKAFLDSGTPLRGKAENALVTELREAFALSNGHSNGGPNSLDVLETLVTGDPHVSRDELIRYFAPYERTEYVAKNRRTETVESLLEGPAASFAAIDSSKHISQAFGIAALMFNENADDVTPVDTRFWEKTHFSFIRRSTGHLDSLIVHGLKFAPHAGRAGYTYFSEKYERHDHDGAPLGSRESRGVAFFDQNYVYGISRTAHKHTLTNFVGQRPGDDDFYWFDGMLTTSNSSGARISAKGLCLWHETESHKRALTGVRSTDDLLAAFRGDKFKSAVEKWLDTPERQSVIVL